MIVTTIYDLHKVVDDPRYEGFATIDGSPSLLGRTSVYKDFFPVRRDDWSWSIEPISQLWKPLNVIGRVGSYNDFPCLNMLVPVFSERAVNVLRDMLEPNGELLPLVHPAGKYYAYNCTKIVKS